MLATILVICAVICFALQALDVQRLKWWAAGVAFLIAALYLAPKL